MKFLDDFSNIFKRYDLDTEVKPQEARQISKDPVLQEIGKLVVEGEAEDIEPVVEKALASKSPMDVINGGLIAGMNEVSRLWDEGIYFLPQVILAADAMNAGIALCEKKMGKPMARKGKVVTHTAEGDIHDIGQIIANALLNAGGFEVINLGCDCPVDTVVSTVKAERPIMVTGTALMTTTMTAFPKICHQLEAAGIVVPFISGGGAVAEEWSTSFPLSIWGKEDGWACGLAEDALAGMSWEDMRSKWNG
jgi:methanol corrinoid protein